MTFNKEAATKLADAPACHTLEKAQLRIIALQEMLAQALDALAAVEKNQRTPGTKQLCARCNVDATWWLHCIVEGDPLCPIKPHSQGEGG